jgi:hypothetical protein
MKYEIGIIEQRLQELLNKKGGIGDEGRFVGPFHAKKSNENIDVTLSNLNATPIGSATLAKTTVANIAKAIQPMLKSFVHDQQWTLISEPGRYLLKEQQFWQAECIGRDCCLQS